MKIAAIADDITGATDLAAAIRQAGLSVVQTIGVPDSAPEADAVVVALEVRMAPVAAATAAASAALAVLETAGAAHRSPSRRQRIRNCSGRCTWATCSWARNCWPTRRCAITG